MVTPTEDYYSDHDGGMFAPIEATTVATWKAPAFLENLAIDAEGAVFVTVYSHKRVDRYDPATRQPGRWDVWLQGDRLRSIVPKFPGSNGIKIRQGWAWISVSGRRLLVHVPIQPDGSAGAIEIAATRLTADDFAFGLSGSVYVTTHPEHTLVRLDPSGARKTLAGPEQGMVGSTACAFGRAPGDEKALYVTTDGGFLIPHESGIQNAKLVRMEVGESGWPLLQGV
jgi:sugar lactone lactonase YvrE